MSKNEKNLTIYKVDAETFMPLPYADGGIKTEIEQLLLPFPAYQMNAYLIDNDFLKKPSNDPTILDKAS